MTGVARIKLLILLTLLLAGTALSARKTNPKKVPKNAVLLSKVSAITVRAGKQTTFRRVSPVPQLQCVGPSRICKLYTVDVMRCTNEGSDYDENNVQWSCKASLPDEFKLGSTEVTCEGYESSEDPYVLSGSCGVEYTLLLTEKGEEKYGSGSFFDFRGSRGNENSGEKYAGYLFMVLFGLVLFIILRGLYNAWRNDTPRRRPRGGGGFGGGGDDNDPPPPYDPRPPPRPKKATWSSGSGSGSGSRSGHPSAGNQEQGWRPGFWTGTAAGAAAGYFAGRGARTQPEPPQPRPAFGGWFGGGGGGGGGGYEAPTRPRPSSSRTTSSPSSSYSSTRHQSTGFGGTSRR
ncbi:uncharacterized protein Z520_03019 [Fonsecaea multimorphosa CBS 102226]|uniref:Store-operated calcium entry-associated regulatory factor n=1 Tax=Fonsecaea multimorphosa CBS 102226 TaxID=1442371 RepID=A0A0D2IWW7_9EURO|nr:uncharacterized protein Z520_03019 [Fonsecaea multimorphosa CBS 102226]KIY01467.1 hypothetical protein Z520_03019 [Fonsecaea multimorphosa CBS 102226]OAL28231.1 hypothetical protein AYO22_02937 [Fonsecaea multimorphosa]